MEHGVVDPPPTQMSCLLAATRRAAAAAVPRLPAQPPTSLRCGSGTVQLPALLQRAALRDTARLPVAAALWTPCRGLAKKAAVKKGKEEKPAASDASSSVELHDVVTGLNVFKDGSKVLPGLLADGKDPEVLPDSEYPEWVFTLHEKLPTLDELKDKHAKDPDNMTEEEKWRMIKQWNKKRIKDRNQSTKKK